MWFVLHSDSFVFTVTWVPILQPDYCQEMWLGVGFGVTTNCLVIRWLHGWPDGLFPFPVTFHKAGNQSGWSDMADTDVTSTRISLRPLLGWCDVTLQPWGNNKVLWLWSQIKRHTLFLDIIISVVGRKGLLGYDFDINKLNPCCALATFSFL